MEQESGSCPICLEPWDKSTHTPKFLSCHHTLCLDCVTTLFENAVAGEGEGLGGGGGGGGRGGEEEDSQGRRGRGRRGSPSEEVSSPRSPTSISSRFFQFRAPENPRNPKVPSDSAILCPMCRSPTLVRDPTSLQTNFYLGALPRTPSVPRLLLWCETCDAIAEPACGDHSVHPLPDKVKALKDEVTSSGLLLLEDMCSFLAEENRHLQVYKWLCVLLRSARDQVNHAFVKSHNNYNAVLERVKNLQHLLDECDAVYAKEEDEEKITGLSRLQMTLRSNYSSWYGEEYEGEEGREGEREAGAEKKKMRISLPVLQDLFHIHVAFQPPESFQKAHVILETNVDGATLSFFSETEIEEEEEAEEKEKREQTEVDGLRRSSRRRSQNHKKGRDKRSFSFSVTDAAHRRLGSSRSPSMPAGTCQTLPASSRTPSGSHQGAPTGNLGTNTMPSSRRGGLSLIVTPSSAGVPTLAARLPPPPVSSSSSQGSVPELVLRPLELASCEAEEPWAQQGEQNYLFPDGPRVEASCAPPPLPPRSPRLHSAGFLESRGEPSPRPLEPNEDIVDLIEFLEEVPFPTHPQPEARPDDRRRRRGRRPGGQSRGGRRHRSACVII